MRYVKTVITTKGETRQNEAKRDNNHVPGRCSNTWNQLDSLVMSQANLVCARSKMAAVTCLQPQAFIDESFIYRFLMFLPTREFHPTCLLL